MVIFTSVMGPSLVASDVVTCSLLAIVTELVELNLRIWELPSISLNARKVAMSM